MQMSERTAEVVGYGVGKGFSLFACSSSVAHSRRTRASSRCVRTRAKSSRAGYGGGQGFPAVGDGNYVIAVRKEALHILTHIGVIVGPEDSRTLDAKRQRPSATLWATRGRSFS